MSVRRREPSSMFDQKEQENQLELSSESQRRSTWIDKFSAELKFIAAMELIENSISTSICRQNLHNIQHMLSYKLITFKKFLPCYKHSSLLSCRCWKRRRKFGENSIHTSHIFRFYSLLLLIIVCAHARLDFEAFEQGISDSWHVRGTVFRAINSKLLISSISRLD